MTERITVEFDDRYGGARPPWNYCRGQCEAMGVIPVKLSVATGGRPPIAEFFEQDEGLLARAWEQHARGEGHEDGRCDGWHFVQCPDCGGTGEVSPLRALRYLPGKAWSALRFVWRDGVLGHTQPPWATRREHMVTVLRIAVGRSAR